MLKKFEMRLYMGGWMDNVGAPYGLEMAVISAFRDHRSLIDWFGTSDVDYDEDYLLQWMQENYGEQEQNALPYTRDSG
jgi:hypothetical protein